MKFRGLYPATVTPFDKQLKIDTGALEKHFHATSEPRGVSGLVVNGHIGEVLTLSDAEREQVVRIAVGCRRPGQVVVAGVEGRTAEKAVRHAARARDAGADALLVLPPFDVRPYRKLVAHVDSVKGFFEELDAKVGLPMVVFQYPKRSLCSYPVDVLSAISEVKSVAAIKVAAENTTDYAEVWESVGDRLSILAASDSPPLLGMLLYGAHGALIGISVIGTEHWSEMVSAAAGGQAERARAIYKKVAVPLMDAVFENQQPTTPVSDAATTKEALVQLGQIPSSRVRPPAVGVDHVRAKLIGEGLRQAGLLE